MVIMLSYYVFYSMCSVLYSGDYVVLLCVLLYVFRVV